MLRLAYKECLLNTSTAASGSERRVLWIAKPAADLAPITVHLQAYSVAWCQVGCCGEALDLISAWPPHLLVLDQPSGPAPPLTWHALLAKDLPAVDPYQPGGAWHRPDHPPRFLPLLFLTDAPNSLPPAWLNRVNCRSRDEAPVFLQAWLNRPLDPPAPDDQPLLIIDFVRNTVWVQGVPLDLPPRTLQVLAVLAAHHPRPLMATTIARHMHDHAHWRTSESGVRAAIQALRTRLHRLPDAPALLANRGEGYTLDLGPFTGSLEDRIWFWTGVDAWWSPDTPR